jgi:hypothetical protein
MRNGPRGTRFASKDARSSDKVGAELLYVPFAVTVLRCGTAPAQPASASKDASLLEPGDFWTCMFLLL